MSKKATISGLVIGGAIGAVSALLLAPKPGKELRADLTNQGRMVADKTVEIAGNVKEKAVNVATNVGSIATDLKDSVVSKSAVVVDAAKETLSSAKATADIAKEATSEIAADTKNAYKAGVDSATQS